MAKKVSKTAAPKAKTGKAPAASTKTAPAKAAAPSKSRFTGKNSGLKVFEYQNQSLVENEKARRTDDELAKDWREEFPSAMKFDAKMVRHVRNLYNKGKHKNEVPAKPLHGYDEDGNVIPNRGEGKAAKPAEPSAKTPTKTPTKTVSKPAEKSKLKVVKKSKVA